MKTSKRTKDLRKRRNIYLALSTILWVGAMVFTVISTFICVGNSGGIFPIFSEEFKHLLLSLGITGIIGLVLTLFIKDKMRVAMWMLSLCICTAIYKEVGMYSILACWALDEYVFATLTKYYQTRLVINKEIDMRG